MRNKGFTIIELSIVLVIIGLLIGGILAAQTMITTAKTNKVVSIISQYDVAAQNFKTKFNQIPGDSPQFSPAGNGDGKIYSNRFVYSGLNAGFAQETFYFWQHLNQSGDISNETFIAWGGGGSFDGDFTGLQPKLDYGTDCFLGAFSPNVTELSAETSDFGNAWTIAAGTAGGTLLHGCITPILALALDSKLDDRSPVTGDVQVMYPANGPYIARTGYSGDCAHPDPWPTFYYTVSNTTPECHLVIKPSW